MRIINLLMFMLGLSLVFIPFSHACDNPPNNYGYAYGDTEDCTVSALANVYMASNLQNFLNQYCTGTLHCMVNRLGVVTSGVTPDDYDCILAGTCEDEPAHCSDGVKSGEETGIDCGGSCSADCAEYCPEGSHNYVIDGAGGCHYATDPDNLGNCPSGYVLDDRFLSDPFCSKEVDPVSLPVGSDPGDYTEDETTSFVSGTFSVFESSSSSTTDNGDGTSTTTSTSSSTNSNGSGSTTTTTTIINNGSGGVVSSETSTSGETSAEDNPENYDYNLGDGDGDFDGSLSEDDIPEENDISQLFTNFLDDSPITAMITGNSIKTSSSICELHWTYKGKDVVFSFCDEPWPSTLNFMGQILIFMATISTYFIIMGRD